MTTSDLSIGLSACDGLLSRLKEHSLESYFHSLKVGRYAQAIARSMKLDSDYIQAAYIAGLLHDIGKLGVPKDILEKPGKLSYSEKIIIQKHPIYGRDLLIDFGFPNLIVRAVHEHHERCDSKGYPKGRKCEHISLLGKILAVADVYDAVTSPRSYRRRTMTKEQAALYLKENKGYDDTICEALAKALLLN